MTPSMKVKDVMSKTLVVIPAQATYEQAARLLHEHNLTGAPVVEGERIVGILSDKDLYRVLFPWYQSFSEDPEEYLDFEAREQKIAEVRHKPIALFMTRDVITTHPDALVMRVGAIMLARRIHRLPVIKNNKLIGMVTREHIYHRLVAHHLA